MREREGWALGEDWVSDSKRRHDGASPGFLRQPTSRDLRPHRHHQVRGIPWRLWKEEGRKGGKGREGGRGGEVRTCRDTGAPEQACAPHPQWCIEQRSSSHPPNRTRDALRGRRSGGPKHTARARHEQRRALLCAYSLFPAAATTGPSPPALPTRRRRRRLGHTHSESSPVFERKTREHTTKHCRRLSFHPRYPRTPAGPAIAHRPGSEGACVRARLRGAADPLLTASGEGR